MQGDLVACKGSLIPTGAEVTTVAPLLYCLTRTRCISYSHRQYPRRKSQNPAGPHFIACVSGGPGGGVWLSERKGPVNRATPIAGLVAHESIRLPYQSIGEPSGVCRGSQQHSMRNQVARQRLFGKVFDMTAAGRDTRKGVITTIDTRCAQMSALRGARGSVAGQRLGGVDFEGLVQPGRLAPVSRAARPVGGSLMQRLL